MAQSHYPNEPIVVVGSGCRFPGGASTPSKLWELLERPRDVQSRVPKDRFDIDSFYHPDGTHHGRTNAPYAYFLQEDLRPFDAGFFNIQAGEADSMDPQQRLLLETVYEAVCNAGMRIQDLQGTSTAVYVGMMTHDYETVSTRDLDNIPTYSATGVAVSIASNRVSYFFDWHGPSMTIDTACSSSLAAVHLAVQQLRSGQSTMAVAAGANLILGPMTFVLESKLNMLSPNGRSRMWDADADGYARGEGVCSVILKTLSQALRDGDQIECVIRETGLNQDGRTTGITMPSHSAQEALIRSVYARAGLDITKTEDRCQFFEAHGTGTPAGDPQEAAAIASAFFKDKEDTADDEQDRLFVGSIKTIIGHTEGTAGIAGLMKASFAVQKGVIPPNLLFDKLSPRVAPFYKHLKIATEPTPWPVVAPGQPRRVSVNSFGFGGTNAHAIVEEYMKCNETCSVEDKHADSSVQEADACNLPLVFSAKSQRSLKATLEGVLDMITRAESVIELHDLASTLLRQRSILPFRRAIVGHSKEAVCLALQAAIEDGNAVTDFSTDTKGKLRVLGVFTGQGAQWPGMLRSLVHGMPFARSIIQDLDRSLQTLPEKFRPTWKLQDKLEGDGTDFTNATISQPLCCAIQIVLVQLLAASAIQFTTIVGHSSGEIACAFAAGFISAAQAIRIAYLRGIVSSQNAASPSGQGGAMLAAGLSYDDAQDLCQLDVFEGRVCVAASNSQDSVTFSGDADAIEHVKGVLDDESVFARHLRVDKAYHSHHMAPCADPYVQALIECGCAGAAVPTQGAGNGGDTASGRDEIAWYSSVHADCTRMTKDEVTAEYWKDNLVSPVLFSQAVQRAVVTHRSLGLDVAIEVGPHPALKGPTLSTVKDILGGVELPYTGCLERNKNDLEAFAAALGFLWERFGVASVDAESLTSKVSPERRSKSLAKVLPAYPWDHTRRHWTESRATHEHLHGQHPHLLLGKLAYDTASKVQWTNFIRPRDLEWLDGHALQGQTVFPAAGYIVMAMEAAMQIATKRGLQVQLLEIMDMDISKAVVFEDENSLVELNLSIETMVEPRDGFYLLSFIIDSCLAKETGLSASANGQVVITYSDKLRPSSESSSADAPVLPPSDAEQLQMNKVNISSFYRELDAMGYDYSKDFRCMQSLSRADSKASGELAFIELRDQVRDQVLLMHPAPLDIAFQTVIGAYSSPGDRRLRSLYVPTHIDRIALVPSLCVNAAESGIVEELGFNTINTYDKGDYLSGDIVVFDKERTTLFQVENIVFKPFSPPNISTDHRMFSRWVWGPLTPDTLLDKSEHWATAQEMEVIPLIERVVHFYMRFFLSSLTTENRQDVAAHLQNQIRWFEDVLGEARRGGNVWYEKAWEEDTMEHIQRLCAANSNHPHMRLVQRVGENMQSVFLRGHNPFELMDYDGLLTEFYANTMSFGPALHYAQELVNQIAHRFQNMDILEIGAGTGGATKHVLSTPQLGFNSYTYTDISTGFFETARERFADFEDRMIFEPLDIRRSPKEQGFQEHAYDLIIASNVLHATPNLQDTMTNVRSLLKPGGHAVILEITHSGHTRLGFLFGLFSDWWAGVDDRRIREPFISLDHWDTILKGSGFSGIDSRTLDRDAILFPTSVLSTHAVDSRMRRLYEPLSAPPKDTYPPLVVVGGELPRTRRIVEQTVAMLPQRDITSVATLESVLDDTRLKTKSTFLILADLDNEVFGNLNEDLFEAVKSLLVYASSILWITNNAWVDHPNQAGSIGMLRSVRREYPDMGIQVLDVDSIDTLNSAFVASQVLRLEECGNDNVSSATWTNEPEIYWCKERAWVSRLKHDITRNNRMNSARRAIMGSFDPLETPVALKSAHTQLHEASSTVAHYYLESAETWQVPNDSSDDKATIRVRYSISKAIRFGNLGHYYIVQGSVMTAAGEESVIAISKTSASVVTVPKDWTSALPKSDSLKAWSNDSCALLPATAAILAATISKSTHFYGPGAQILIFEAPYFAIDAIREACGKLDIKVHFMTTSTQVNTTCSSRNPADYVQLHGKETELRLKQALPSNLVAYFDMSNPQGDGHLRRRLERILPRSCMRHSNDLLIHDAASSGPSIEDEEINHSMRDFLAAAFEHLKSCAIVDSGPTPMLPAIRLASGLNTERLGLSTVLDWKTEGRVPARIRPIDCGKLFTGNRTYLLVGLTGDLGRSLCRWMVLHGAKYVVLTSRNPHVDPCWLSHVESLGGHITVLSMDVADESSVDAGLTKIKHELKLPPIGGIAFGPLVLQDVMLKNMDFLMMDMVLKPKVRGAQILHERFSTAASEESLDFFVMFSSIVAVMGNPGQANYSAANAFLQGLAQQRSANGLAGSTIDIGAVYGVGFVTRAELEEDFNAIRFMFDSVEEHELHTLFAEAVVSGRSAIQGRLQEDPILRKTVIDMSDIQLTTGIPDLDPALKERIVFFDDARVGNLKIPEQRSSSGASPSGTIGSLKEQLMLATSLDVVRQIVVDGLSNKLRTTLQIPDGESVHPTIPLIDQGVDSLGAVTVGSWFSKHLHLDLPLLKVLGGASVTDLADDAAMRLPPSAIPLVDGVMNVEGDEHTAPTTPKDTDSSTPGTQSDNSSAEDEDADVQLEAREMAITRHENLSLAQDYSWRLQSIARDPTIFNSTIGMFMKGTIDLNRLRKAFIESMQRHEIFRTGFTVVKDDDGNSTPVQTVFNRPNSKAVKIVRVTDRAAAMEGYKQLQHTKYDLEAADTLRLVDYHWSTDEHLLVVAYHRLCGDGSTTENLFVEASQLYNGVTLKQPSAQFVDLALRQRHEWANGSMDDDVAYWVAMHTKSSSASLASSGRVPLPLMRPLWKTDDDVSQEGQGQGQQGRDWQQHEAIARLDPMVAFRIKERSRKHKATPMHFYLAAYNVLLARLTGSNDFTIGIADTNRTTMEEVTAMGYFANLLPLRFDSFVAANTFSEHLTDTKSRLREAMQHARVPYGVVLDRMDLELPAFGDDATSQGHAPLFQAVFDYKQGQAESGSIGSANMTEVIASRERTPYDVVLEMSDDPTRDPLITVKLQAAWYGPQQAKAFLESYVSILSIFSMNPALKLA